MIISIIVAVSKNQVIGLRGDLPWKLSTDFQHFKNTTAHHTVIMGRKTFEALGKPLPNRHNIIITRQTDFDVKDIQVVNSLEKAIDLAKTMEKNEIFIIGGGEIYAQSIDLVDKIYLTVVDAIVEGDAFFPKIDFDEWNILQKTSYQADEKNNFDFEILELNRKTLIVKHFDFEQ